MRFVVITGPSGAGKTLALHSFEDGGYYTADNLPPCLLPNLADFCRKTGRERCAVVVDARSGAAFFVRFWPEIGLGASRRARDCVGARKPV